MVTIQRVFQRINIRNQNVVRLIPNKNVSVKNPNASLLLQSRSISGLNNAAAVGGTHRVGFGNGGISNNISDYGSTPQFQTLTTTRSLSSTPAPSPTTASKTADVDGTTTPVADDAPVGERRGLPTRHSRKETPKVAPFESLDDARVKLMDAIPGTLFVYESTDLKLTKPEEYANGLSKSYHTQQMAEYILRGYNVTLPNSLVQTTHPESITDEQWKPPVQLNDQRTESYVHTLEQMISLLERIELEGSVYVELRSKFRAQLARRNENDNHNDTPSDTQPDNPAPTDVEDKQASTMTQLTTTYGAPPGPSTVMYDLILDAIASTLPSLQPSSAITWIKRADSLRLRALARHNLDIDARTDSLNLESLPTPLTFNAVLRAAANATYDGTHEELRDVALNAAFVMYDGMHHHSIVSRNTATYRDVLRAVGKYMPVSPSKGNIAYALFVKACEEERVLDETIVDVLLNGVVTYGGAEGEADSLGMDFDNWIETEVKVQFTHDKNGYGFPIKWSSKKKTKRYDRRFAAY